MAEEATFIKVNYKGKTVSIEVDGSPRDPSTFYLKYCSFKHNFPKGNNLSFKKDGIDHLLKLDNDVIRLKPNVELYDVYYIEDENMSQVLDVKGAKRLRYEDMLKDLNKSKELAVSDAKKNRKDNFKANKQNKKMEVNPDQKFLKRNVYVTWMHRDHFTKPFEHLGSKIAPHLKIIFNGHIKYLTVESVLDRIKEEYIKENNKMYFQESLIELGNGQCEFIDTEKFTNKNGDDIDFWAYAAEYLRDTGNRLNVSLLTTKFHNFSNISSKIVSQGASLNENSDISKKYEKKSTSIFNPEPYKYSLSLMKDIKSKQEISINSENKDFMMSKSFSSSNNDFKKYSYQNRDSIKSKTENIRPRISDFEKYKSKKEILKTDTSSLFHKTQKNEFSKSCNHKNKVTEENNVNLPEKKSVNVITPRSPRLESPNNKDNQMSGFNDLILNKFKQPLAINDYLKNKIEKEKNNDMNPKLDKIHLRIPIYPVSEIKFIKKLGEGAQGEVHLCKVLGAEYAVKVMKVDIYESLILKEILILQKVNHPNLINIMGICSSPSNYYLLTSYFESISLYDLLFKKLEPLSETNKNVMIEQILAGLTYLHSETKQKPSIVHRDLKPANILVNSNFQTKICDLGLCKCDDIAESLKSNSVHIRGTTVYMAPEQLITYGVQTTRSDVWAAAVTIVEVYNRKKAWNIDHSIKNKKSISEQIVDQILSHTILNQLDSIPIFARNSVRSCFNLESQKRPSARELLEVYVNKF